LEDFKFDLIMCDEGHNVTAQGVFSDVMDHLDADAKRIFITATPKINAGEVKGNTRGMGNKKFYGDFIYTMSFSQAVKRGFILPIRRLFIDTYGKSEFCAAHLVDTVIKTMNRMKQAMGDSPLPNKVIFVFDSAAEIEIITDNWERICLETGATVFTAVSDKDNFCVNGSHPDGTGNMPIRQRFISEFKKTKSDCILAHIDTMGEGIDVPGITGCILFGAGDVVRIIQNIGRAMRVLQSDREQNLKKSERVKKVALLGMVSYNGETSGQEFLSRIARAMREMSSDDFYKNFLSFEFRNRGASKSQPDDVGGGTGNYIAEHQMDLAGFDTTIEDDTPLFDDGDCPPDEIIALDLMMVEQGEQERRQQEQEEQDAATAARRAALAERMRQARGNRAVI
jgi:superfamily II DNA or RNA helicase